MTSVCLCALIQLFIFYCCLVMLKEEHLRETVKSKVLDRKMNGFMILDFTLIYRDLMEFIFMKMNMNFFSNIFEMK